MVENVANVPYEVEHVVDTNGVIQAKHTARNATYVNIGHAGYKSGESVEPQ